MDLAFFRTSCFLFLRQLVATPFIWPQWWLQAVLPASDRRLPLPSSTSSEVMLYNPVGLSLWLLKQGQLESFRVILDLVSLQATKLWLKLYYSLQPSFPPSRQISRYIWSHPYWAIMLEMLKHRQGLQCCVPGFQGFWSPSRLSRGLACSFSPGSSIGVPFLPSGFCHLLPRILKIQLNYHL